MALEFVYPFMGQWKESYSPNLQVGCFNEWTVVRVEIWEGFNIGHYVVNVVLAL
jgi:hypothetical protein